MGADGLVKPVAEAEKGQFALEHYSLLLDLLVELGLGFGVEGLV